MMLGAGVRSTRSGKSSARACLPRVARARPVVPLTPRGPSPARWRRRASLYLPWRRARLLAATAAAERVRTNALVRPAPGLSTTAARGSLCSRAYAPAAHRPAICRALQSRCHRPATCIAACAPAVIARRHSAERSRATRLIPGRAWSHAASVSASRSGSRSTDRRRSGSTMIAPWRVRFFSAQSSTPMIAVAAELATGAARISRSSVSPLVGMPSRWARRLPASPPGATPTRAWASHRVRLDRCARSLGRRVAGVRRWRALPKR